MNTIRAFQAFLIILIEGASTAQATIVTITASSSPVEGFFPNVATAVCGDTIKWVNGDGTHTTASKIIPTGASSWNSSTIGSSGFSYVVSVPGTYNYTCHPSGGGHMDASFVVTCAPALTLIAVPADFATIQEGIDAATIGDTVLVSPGTYFENINFNGKDIVLASLYLTTGDMAYIEQTIIDGRDSSSVVTFTSGESAAALITGFNIKHGYGASWLDGDGGGLCCINASPTIDHNQIDSNRVSFADGGGIYCENSNAVITNNSMVFNGGGYVDVGTGIACVGGSPYIANNIITGSWGDSNCGIDLVSSNATITNNTLVYNGMGIRIRDTSSVNVSNTIIWGNSFANLLLSGTSSTVDVMYSDVEGGYIGTGNVDLDPKFTDTINNDFSLLSSSPCIDAADPNSPDDADGTRADMGALFFEQNVGINEDAVVELPRIKVYPNPFNSQITVQFENMNGDEHTLMLYNSMGQIVRVIENITRGEVIVKRENLKSGPYFFQLIGNSGHIDHGQMIAE